MMADDHGGSRFTMHNGMVKWRTPKINKYIHILSAFPQEVSPDHLYIIRKFPWENHGKSTSSQYITKTGSICKNISTSSHVKSLCANSGLPHRVASFGDPNLLPQLLRCPGAPRKDRGSLQQQRQLVAVRVGQGHGGCLGSLWWVGFSVY